MLHASQRHSVCVLICFLHEHRRDSHFQRAMATFTAADGRSGVGWIEWNINRH
jgi:hypothetical protein